MTLAPNTFIYYPRTRQLFWRCQPLREPGVNLVALIAQVMRDEGRVGSFILTNN